MGIIRNPTLFSRHFGIKKQKIEESGLFDPMLNVDTNLFVDPVLLKRSRHREISTSATAEYRKRFYQIISLLKASRKKDDAAWRAAKRMIQLREVQGTCLGYGASSISGRSVAASIQETILVTAKEIVDAGIEEPELFLLLPLFEEGIGPDTISDFTTSVIEDSLLRFTARMAPSPEGAYPSEEIQRGS